MLKIIDATLQNLTLTLPNLPSLLAMIHVVVIRTKMSIKVSVKENEVPTEKRSSRASIFATHGKLYIKLKLKD